MPKLPTLSYHQWRGGLIGVYKMLHGFYDKETASFIKLWTEVAERQAGRGLPEGTLTKIIKTYKAKCIWD